MVEKSHTAETETTGWQPSFMPPLQGIGKRISEFFTPQSDATASEEKYEINMELPGVSLDDIKIEVHDNQLTVQGEKQTESEEKGKTYFFSERAFGAFQRSFKLPSNSVADKITANFKDGVLTIRVPKAGASPETSRRIKIN